MAKIKLPNPCPIKNISKKIPEPLYRYITRELDRINEILSAPQKYECELKQKELKFPNIGIFEYNEADELNKFSDVVEALTSPIMIDLWNKFYKLNQTCLPTLFMFIQNHYYGATHKAQSILKSKEQAEFDKHIIKYHALSEDPSELLAIVESLIILMDEFNGIIRPDGFDCFEDMDVNEPANKMFLRNGKIPYHINWDLYITDDEYDTFMDILRKIADKLNNRKLKNQTEYRKNVKFLVSPNTRKRGIAKAPEILMIRVLYLHFIELFGKPLNEDISIIISELFHSEYTANDIVKLTKPVRDRIKDIKQYMRKNGFVKRTNSFSIEEFLYEHL